MSAPTPIELVVQSKFHAALSKPMYQRCYELERLFDETNVKELQAIYPALVEHIFGFNSQTGWSLLQISKSRLYQDYSALIAFLGPCGALFRLIYKLLCDEYQRFEFSMSCLPYPTKMKFEDGNIPSMYRTKIQPAYASQMQNSLWLNAFDFYFFHFAFYITNHTICKISTADAPNENLYFSLLESYLEYFLPLKGKDVPPMPHEMSPVRGPILHHSHALGSVRSPTGYRQMSEHAISSPVSRYPTLFRQSVSPYQASPASTSASSLVHCSGSSLNGSGLLYYQSPSATSRHYHHYHHQHGVGDECRHHQDNWRTESIVQTLVEFWLNQNNMAEIQEMSTPPMDQYMPSVDHVRCCRMLIKHVHYFVNSLQPSLYHAVVTTSLDDFKRNIWSCYVQRKLYIFLKHGFKKWPLDSSFRMMLEAWLSYIQPWRYLDPNQVERDDRPEVVRHSVGTKYTGFIRDNLLFYAELFQDFLVRIGRTDLSSARNAFMLYRVAKIYGITDIAVMIERAESELLDPVARSPPARSHPDLASSYLSSNGASGPSQLHQDLSLPTVLVTLQSSDMENSTFVYRALFTEKTKHQVEQLLFVVAQAKQNLNSAKDKVNDMDTGSSILSWLGLTSLQDYNYSLYPRPDDGADGRKTAVHLDQSLSLLKGVFRIDDGRLSELNQSCQSDRSANESLNQPSKLLPPDHLITDEGLQLTPLGRYQVVSGLRKFPVLYNGDPELRPIASYENASLVRWLYQIATCINEQTCELLADLYERKTFGARMIQHLVLPPYKPGTSPQKSHSARQPQTLLQRKLAERPRVSLRFLASYRTLMYLSVLYVFAYIWIGMGPIGFAFVLSMSLLLWAAFKAQFSKVHVN